MRILISGYYGFGNLGDEALLAGMLGGLRARGHQVEVLSGRPELTRRLHDVPARHRLYGLLSGLRHCEALISGGGGLLQDRTSRRSLGYYLAVVRTARLLGKRVVVFGQSIGPLSAAGRSKVARALAGLPIAVRDAPSVGLLADLGLEAERFADPALLLEDSRPPAPPNPGTRVLLIPRGGHRDLTLALLETGRLLEQAGQLLAGLSLHPEQDDPELDILGSGLPRLARMTAADPWAALDRISGARYVVSTRLHGLILAAAAGRPFCGLVYDPKVAGFLATVEAPALHPPVDPAALAARVLESVSAPAAAVERERRAAEEGLRWLERALQPLRTTR